MYERYVGIAISISIVLWIALSLSGLDVQWLGIAIDGGLLKRDGR
jgi:hypothetical protein